MLGSIAAAVGIGSAVAGTIGGIYSANKSASSAKQTMRTSIAWERERAKNAHQWEVEDLKNAGLNPVLSNGGQGAATSGVAPVTPDTSGYMNAGNALSTGLQNFLQGKELENQTNIANAQSDNLQAQAQNIRTQTKWYPKETAAKIANMQSQTDLMTTQNAYENAVFAHKVNQQIAATGKEIAEGYISERNADFLKKYNITRSEAIQLGESGLRVIGNLITAGVSGKMIKTGIKAMLRENATTGSHMMMGSKGGLFMQ